MANDVYSDDCFRNWVAAIKSYGVAASIIEEWFDQLADDICTYPVGANPDDPASSFIFVDLGGQMNPPHLEALIDDSEMTLDTFREHVLGAVSRTAPAGLSVEVTFFERWLVTK